MALEKETLRALEEKVVECARTLENPGDMVKLMNAAAELNALKKANEPTGLERLMDAIAVNVNEDENGSGVSAE